MKNFLVLLTAVLVLSSCKKTISDLPAVTDTGANTFGLKLNGNYWVPQKFGAIATAPILEARVTGLGDLVINARNYASEPKESEFEIFIKNATGPGTYELNQNTDAYPNQSASYAYYVERKINPINEWITSTQYGGSVTITKLDLTNHIASGTFQFTTAPIDGAASNITVTDGRFDVTLQ